MDSARDFLTIQRASDRFSLRLFYSFSGLAPAVMWVLGLRLFNIG
jgi:hypothetical protein